MFDTKRSDLGELLYRLKYRSDASVLDEIVQVAARFYRSWNPGATVIVPVPPSRSSRPQQPVSMIAAALGGQLSIAVEQNAITRVKEVPELKDIFAYDDRLRALEGGSQCRRVRRPGTTGIASGRSLPVRGYMNAITAALYDQGGVVDDVYALAVTRTRSRS